MSVTAAPGFVAAGRQVGIKKPGGLDLALVVAEDGPVPAAGVFTRNRAAGSAVTISRRRLRGGRARAVLLNSGCANAGTGRGGVEATEIVTARLGQLLDVDPELVLMCSTGPIGSPFPTDEVLAGLPGLVAEVSTEGADDAAQAILTTDSHAKTVTIVGEGFIVGGMAKGAGMLRPDLATMLCVLTTDAEVRATTMQAMLEEAVGPTFNSLNVDGCESTNDTVLLLSSGRGSAPSAQVFGEVLERACRNLARALAADAEGASRVVTLLVSGADDDAGARTLGRVVADSGLVRASFFGADPNWGRILAALGTQGVDPDLLSISYQGIPVAGAGIALPVDQAKLAGAMESDFTVAIEVGPGPGRAEVITTDLTPDYVAFNGERS